MEVENTLRSFVVTGVINTDGTALTIIVIIDKRDDGYMADRLPSKSVLITGGASGIGRAIAKRFAEEGANVAIADKRKEPRLEETPTHEYLIEQGHQAEYIKMDVTSPAEVQRAVHATVDAFGSIDILINSAAVVSSQPIDEVTEEEYNRIVDANQKGTYFASKYAVSEMEGQTEGGAIVNISSVAGIEGGDKLSVYCTSKGGVSNFTRALAIEQGPNDIRVNAINPGTTRTGMTVKDLDKVGTKGDRVPLRRDADPRDIANAALYLASDEASFVTGHNLVVDGGASVKYF